MESTSKIMLIGIENASCGYTLISEIWKSEGPPPDVGGPFDFQMLSPVGECFAPIGGKGYAPLLLEDPIVSETCSVIQ